jgi:hypothetical protein
LDGFLLCCERIDHLTGTSISSTNGLHITFWMKSIMLICEFESVNAVRLNTFAQDAMLI